MSVIVYSKTGLGLAHREFTDVIKTDKAGSVLIGCRNRGSGAEPIA